MSNKAVLLTIEQACEVTNLGRTKLRQLADESGAVRKVGKVRLNNIDVILDYIEKEYSI